MEMVVKLDYLYVGYKNFDSTGKFTCECGSTEFIRFDEELSFWILFSCLKCGRTHDKFGKACTRGGTEEPVYPIILLVKEIHGNDLFKKYSDE